MPRDYPRSVRVAEQIQHELADLIRTGVSDPRLGMVTLTDLELSPDYRHAKVFFSVLGDADQGAAAGEALNHAAGFLRKELGHRVYLRIIPQLHFVYDESIERGARLSRLIDEAVAPPAESKKKRKS